VLLDDHFDEHNLDVDEHFDYDSHEHNLDDVHDDSHDLDVNEHNLDFDYDAYVPTTWPLPLRRRQ
jgi:hypothetical protein